MADKWFEEIKKEVDTFIKTASDAEIEDAFARANYEFYKHIHTPTIEHHNDIELFLYTEALRVSFNEADPPPHSKKGLTFSEFSRADEYYYYLAA